MHPSSHAGALPAVGRLAALLAASCLLPRPRRLVVLSALDTMCGAKAFAWQAAGGPRVRGCLSRFPNLPRSAHAAADPETHGRLTRTPALRPGVRTCRLSRNVLAHTEPWDREYGVTVDAGAVEALSQHTVDLSLVEALPRVLGQSLVAFNDAMVGALRVLPRHTVEEAAAEFAAQLSGGGDGSVEGLAEGVGSSSGGLSSGTGSGGRRGSSSGGPRRRGVRAMAAECAPARPGPAVGCGQRTPLVYATGRHGGWGQGGPRAATLALRLRVQRSLFAPSAAVGLLRLP